jgi:hypothetical protein
MIERPTSGKSGRWRPMSSGGGLGLCVYRGYLAGPLATEGVDMGSTLTVDIFVSVDGWASGATSPGFGYLGPELEEWITTELAAPQLVVRSSMPRHGRPRQRCRSARRGRSRRLSASRAPARRSVGGAEGVEHALGVGGKAAWSPVSSMNSVGNFTPGAHRTKSALVCSPDQVDSESAA